MSLDERKSEAATNSAPRLERGDGEGLIVAALDFLRGSLSGDGRTPWQDQTPTRQEKDLCEWARSLGLLLDARTIVPRLTRGGMEHDVFIEDDRYFKVTRHGVFGLTPGVELALVPSDEDARRFHLWEATPARYAQADP